MTSAIYAQTVETKNFYFKLNADNRDQWIFD